MRSELPKSSRSALSGSTIRFGRAWDFQTGSNRDRSLPNSLTSNAPRSTPGTRAVVLAVASDFVVAQRREAGDPVYAAAGEEADEVEDVRVRRAELRNRPVHRPLRSVGIDNVVTVYEADERVSLASVICLQCGYGILIVLPMTTSSFGTTR